MDAVATSNTETLPVVEAIQAAASS